MEFCDFRNLRVMGVRVKMSFPVEMNHSECVFAGDLEEVKIYIHHLNSARARRCEERSFDLIRKNPKRDPEMRGKCVNIDILSQSLIQVATRARVWDGSG